MITSVEMPQFIRTPLRYVDDLKGANITAVCSLSRDKVLFVTDLAFLLLESRTLEDEFGHMIDTVFAAIYDTEEVIKTVGLEKALHYGLIDGIAFEQWKDLRAKQEEEQMQSITNADYRKYLDLQKKFEIVLEKRDGKWVHRSRS